MVNYKYNIYERVSQVTFVRKNKFGNVKTKYRGRTYDSRAEATYSQMLDELLESNKIRHIVHQKRYPLQDMKGTKRMAYIADFVVTTNKGKEIIIDVKGVLTADNKVKLAYFQYAYDKKVELVYTTGPDAFRTKFLLD